MDIWYVERKNQGSRIGYESLQQCITGSGVQTLLSYTDKSNDEYVKIELATTTSISDINCMRVEISQKCHQRLIRAAAALFSATLDKNNQKQKEAAVQEQCFKEFKFVVEKEVIENGDSVHLV